MTETAPSFKLAIIFFVTAVALLICGVGFGTFFGFQLAASQCYEIKAERCLGEPLLTECICNGEEGKIKVP